MALVANTKISGANGGTTPAIDTTGATFLAIHLTDGDVASATVSDSKGNTWTQLTAQSGATPNSRLFYVANPTVGTGHTFTATGTSVYCVLTVQAHSGIATTSPFDQQNGFAAATLTSGSNSQPGSITPGVDNELIIAGFAFDSQPTVVSVDSAMTITDQTPFGSGANYGGAMAYKYQTTAAAINPMWTWAETATGGGLTIASFKAAAGGAPAGAAWDPRSAARLWHPGAPGSFLLPIWSVSPAATADISVTAACGVGVATMGFDAHDVTAVASGQAAAGGAGTVTRDISSAAGEQVAVAPRGTVTIDYGATVASEQVAVGGVATPGHDVTATGAEAVAVAETATIAHGVTTAASEAAGAAVTATATTGLTAVASGQAAASLAATVTRDLTGLATEGVAVGGTATTSGVSDVSVFARAGIAAGGTGTITTSRTASASASAGSAPVAAITTGITAAARLDAATSISAAVIIGLALTAIARAATGGTATVTIQSILPLPPLVPPFAAVIDAYATSTVSTTPTTSTVNTTPVGVT